MTAYAIATLNIHDRGEYARYENGFMDIFNQYNGTMLAVDETPQTLEGDWSYTRTVLIEFPSKADLLAWYNSDAYQALLKHRLAASDGNVVMLDVLPGITGRSS